MPGPPAAGPGAELVGQRPVVAVVCDVIYPYSRGGRELRNQELLPRLAGQADVHVYTMRWWDGPPVRHEFGVSYHAISQLHPLYRHGRRSVRQAVWFALASLRLLGCRFDVLEADQIPCFQLFVLRLVATLKRKPFTVTWHEVWSRRTGGSISARPAGLPGRWSGWPCGYRTRSSPRRRRRPSGCARCSARVLRSRRCRTVSTWPRSAPRIRKPTRPTWSWWAG